MERIPCQILNQNREKSI